jgi:hypothetical protein
VTLLSLILLDLTPGLKFISKSNNSKKIGSFFRLRKKDRIYEKIQSKSYLQKKILSFQTSLSSY